MFDFYIGPISNYGFEIWCIQMGLNVERVHLDLWKHILGVKKSTCTAAVYAELGCFLCFTTKIHFNQILP